MSKKKNILEELYYGNINECERRLGKITHTEEYKAYIKSLDKLVASFNEEQEKLFDEYFLATGGYEDVLLKRTYANGVKVGLSVGLELIDFDPSFQNDD